MWWFSFPYCHCCLTVCSFPSRRHLFWKFAGCFVPSHKEKRCLTFCVFWNIIVVLMFRTQKPAFWIASLSDATSFYMTFAWWMANELWWAWISSREVCLRFIVVVLQLWIGCCHFVLTLLECWFFFIFLLGTCSCSVECCKQCVSHFLLPVKGICFFLCVDIFIFDMFAINFC